MMQDFLFRNQTYNEKYRYFVLGKKWSDCYVVELYKDNENDYKIYWGNTSYVEPDRCEISKLLTMALLNSKEDEWQLVNKKDIEMLPSIYIIIEKAKCKIEKYNRK